MGTRRLYSFGEVLRKGSLRQLALGYVVGAWALVDILANASELAGLPLTLARWALVVLAAGLLLILALALLLRGTRPAGEFTSPNPSGRSQALLIVALVAALLPMSVVISENSIRWVMWRDAPIWAAVCLVLAIAFGFAWRRSGVPASLAGEDPGTGATQANPETAV
jgi:hypothetical protein